MAVDEEGVGRTIDVGDVGRVHPHLAPIDPLLERLILAGEQARQRLALHVEMAGIDLELAEDRLGRQLTVVGQRSEEHTSELQSLMRISYAVFCLKKKTQDS